MATLPEKATLPDYQQHIAQFLEETKLSGKSIFETYLLFSEEIGELARSIRYYTGLKKAPDTKDLFYLEEELADVFMYVLDIANQLNLDLETAYRRKHVVLNERHHTT